MIQITNLFYHQWWVQLSILYTVQTFYRVFRSWASKKFMTGWFVLYSQLCILLLLSFYKWNEVFVFFFLYSENTIGRVIGFKLETNFSFFHFAVLGFKLLKSILIPLHVTIWLFCSVILFPIAITFYITWWFIHFVDGFFSPIYAQLGIDIFGKQSLSLHISSQPTRSIYVQFV